MLASRWILTPSRVTAGPRGSPFGAAGRRPIFSPAFGARQRLGVRIQDQLVRVAVQHHELPCLDQATRFVKPDDRRNFERARQNRGVIRLAAGIGRESADLGPIHLRRERRRQLVGDQNRGVIQRAEQIAGGDAVTKIHGEPADEIGDVALALAEVRIRDLVEFGAELVEQLLDGPLGVHPLVSDEGLGAGHEHRIVEHQQLRIEERREVRSAPLAPRGCECRSVVRECVCGRVRGVGLLSRGEPARFDSAAPAPAD